MTERMNYDPNLVTNMQYAKQRVRLVFAAWDNRAVLEVVMVNNRSGAEAITAALDCVYEDIEGVLRLHDSIGDCLTCEDDEDEGVDWLRAMLIKAEILSIEAAPGHEGGCVSVTEGEYSRELDA